MTTPTQWAAAQAQPSPFHPPFGLQQSATAVARFPFPFLEDRFVHSVNLEPVTPGPKGSVTEHPIDLDEHYAAEMIERARVLAQDPRRALEPPEHQDACWEACGFIMQLLSRHYPQDFALHAVEQPTAERSTAEQSTVERPTAEQSPSDPSKEHVREFVWVNRRMGIEQRFRWGDTASLPCPPLEYIARQTQGDFTLQGQRDGHLWLDAGVLTSPADWSLPFNAGMNFQQWHAPVPERVHAAGIFTRAEQFLLRLRAEQPMRRTNWSLTVYPRLDTSPETWGQWGQDRHKVNALNAGELVHLRVELQTLYRLPLSHSILFHIRTYFLNLEQLASKPEWGQRFARVLASLPHDIAAYKGIAVYREHVLQWLLQRGIS